MIGIDHEYIAEDAPTGAEPPKRRPDARVTYCKIMQIGAHDAAHDARSIAHSMHYLRYWE